MRSIFYVPELVLVNILSRLPVKPLLRFKCVDKLWCDLISMHLNNNYASTNLIVNLHGDESLVSIGKDTNLCVDVKLPVTGGLIYIYNSCNGIVCFKTGLSRGGVSVSLWNPATGDYKTLPPSNLSAQQIISDIGFGFDPKSNDYKILMVHISMSIVHQPPQFEFALYSLRSDSWTKLEPNVTCNYDIGSITNFSIKNKNKLGWLVNRAVYEYSWEIVSFDLSNENFEIIQLPRDIATLNLRRMKLFNMRNSELIALITPMIKRESFKIWPESYEVWERDENNSWNKMFSIRATNIGPDPFKIRLVGYSGNEHVIFHDVNNNLFFYNIVTQKVKRHSCPARNNIQVSEYRVLEYKESQIAISKHR